MARKPSYDIDQVRQAASGQWNEILSRIGGIPPESLDGKHHSCPRCGGKDRFRLIDSTAGAVFCNNCFNSNNGDGFAAVQWAAGKQFADALREIAEFCSVQPTKSKKKSKSDPAKHLEFIAWNDSLVALWCLRKKPIKPESLKLVGAKMAIYREQYKVIALPVWGEQLAAADPVGWVILNITGGTVPKFTKGSKDAEWVKIKTTYGSQAGVIGLPDAAATTIWKTEGPTDLLGLLSLDLPSDHSAICNVMGAKEDPSKSPWILRLFEGKTACIVHDCDKPGQEGATMVPRTNAEDRPGWTPAIAKYAQVAKNVILPYPIEETKGKDLRDWISDGGDFQQLLELVDKSDCVEAKDFVVDEDETEAIDDPHRLARVNLEAYEDNHGGRLVYWREEWLKWKDGRYTTIELAELRAKVNGAIKKEFDRAWQQEFDDYKAWKQSAEYNSDVDKGTPKVRKVTRNLVGNVIGAMESICTVPSSRQMPCRLDDGIKSNWLSMENGILDLDAIVSGKNEENWLIDHTPNWFSKVRLDYQFRTDVDCPKFFKYLQLVQENDGERLELLQEWAGYLLTQGNQFQRFMVFEGEGGNGKTVFFAAMTAMLGQVNVSNLALERFDGRFDLGYTYGKMLNIAGDVSEVDGVAEGAIKTFTDGINIMVDRKNKSPLSFVPTAKLMCAWNTRPRLKDKSEGIWRRMELVPFRVRISESQKIYGMDTDQYWIESGEMPGILMWAIIGLERLLKQRRFTFSQVCYDAKRAYYTDSNPVLDFFDDFITTDEEDAIESKSIYSTYKAWCQDCGYRPFSSRQFFKEFVRQFPLAERRRASYSPRPWLYQGVKFSVQKESLPGNDTQKNFF